jgi:hypothetical protein
MLTTDHRASDPGPGPEKQYWHYPGNTKLLLALNHFAKGEFAFHPFINQG